MYPKQFTRMSKPNPQEVSAMLQDFVGQDISVYIGPFLLTAKLNQSAAFCLNGPSFVLSEIRPSNVTGWIINDHNELALFVR